MRLGAPLRIVRPGLWQIEPVRDRQAHVMIGQRQRHRDLAIVRLAQPPAILARHAYRMRALLLKTCVVDDHRFDPAMRLERRRDEISDLAQHRLVRPRRLPDKMQQRLMRRRRAPGRDHRRHRLNALALDRHQQARAIVLQRLGPIRMPKHAGQIFDIPRKTTFALREFLRTPAKVTESVWVSGIPGFVCLRYAFGHDRHARDSSPLERRWLEAR